MRHASNAFWNYSLKLYAVGAVADACLSLQERAGADVNLLLFCCWQGSLGHALGTPFLRETMAAVADWQRQVVVPLRQARRFVKAGIPSIPLKRTEQLRRSIGSVELDAEYLEQLLLLQQIPGTALPVSRQPTPAVIGANLRRYLGLLNIPPEASLNRHLEALQAACRANPSG